jgi:hypothetical protein
MSSKHWSAGRHGVRQWSGDGQRLGAARKTRMTLAIVIPILLAVGAVALVAAGSTGAGKQKLAGATSRFHHHRPVPLPMPTAPPAASGTDCTIAVPANPLSAQGLATPYQLSGDGCSMDNVGTQAFVQATIIDPATGQLSVYEPLVVTQGRSPAVAPVVPAMPADAVVTIDFGFNGDNLTLVSAGQAAAAGQPTPSPSASASDPAGASPAATPSPSVSASASASASPSGAAKG